MRQTIEELTELMSKIICDSKFNLGDRDIFDKWLTSSVRTASSPLATRGWFGEMIEPFIIFMDGIPSGPYCSEFEIRFEWKNIC